MTRIQLDENWPDRMTYKDASHRMTQYYVLLRQLYPRIPENVQFEFRPRIQAIADVRMNKTTAEIRFNSYHIRTYKLAVREFLHEMVHVIWPKTKHGPRFEQRIFRLRRELFHDSMIIF